MFAGKSDEYVIKTAVTVGEACKLLEVCFEYVTEVEREAFQEAKVEMAKFIGYIRNLLEKCISR